MRIDRDEEDRERIVAFILKFAANMTAETGVPDDVIARAFQQAAAVIAADLLGKAEAAKMMLQWARSISDGNTEEYRGH